MSQRDDTILTAEQAAQLAELKRRTRIARRQADAFRAGRRKMPPDEWRRVHEELMGLFEEHWHRTENPVWVWRAIRHGAVGRGKRQALLPVPTWCAAYLHQVSGRITDLANGHDWRKPVEAPPTDLTISVTMRGIKRPRKIGPDAAMAAVTAALGLTRQGFNAFSADAADEQRELILARLEELLEEKPTQAAAARAFMEEASRRDLDTIKEMLREVKRRKRERGG